MKFAAMSWSRWMGIITKEFIQLRRDRLTFGMIVGIPIMQLILFGFAINADPKQLPTAVLVGRPQPLRPQLVRACRTAATSASTTQVATASEADDV